MGRCSALGGRAFERLDGNLEDTPVDLVGRACEVMTMILTVVAVVMSVMHMVLNVGYMLDKVEGKRVAMWVHHHMYDRSGFRGSWGPLALRSKRSPSQYQQMDWIARAQEVPRFLRHMQQDVLLAPWLHQDRHSWCIVVPGCWIYCHQALVKKQMDPRS